MRRLRTVQRLFMLILLMESVYSTIIRFRRLPCSYYTLIIKSIHHFSPLLAVYTRSTLPHAPSLSHAITRIPHTSIITPTAISSRNVIVEPVRHHSFAPAYTKRRARVWTRWSAFARVQTRILSGGSNNIVCNHNNYTYTTHARDAPINTSTILCCHVHIDTIIRDAIDNFTTRRSRTLVRCVKHVGG